MSSSWFVVVVVCGWFVGLCWGHAALVKPTAFNPNPSRSSPCGGSTALAAAVGSVVASSSFQIQWHVIASDGEGAVTMNLNTAGGQTFSGTNVVTLSHSEPAPNALATFLLTYSVPSTASCTASNGICYAQFTASGWFACTALSVSANAAAVPPVSNSSLPSCQKASNLSFCGVVNGNTVLVPGGQSFSNMDIGAQDTVVADLNNPNVFKTPYTAGCASSYQSFVCANTFRLCTNPLNPQPVCASSENASTVLCSLSTSHQEYLIQPSYAIASGADSWGNCAGRTYAAANDTGILPKPNLAAPTFHSHPVVFLILFGLVLLLF